MIDKMAVLSDIHGNRWALEAVLKDIKRRGIQHIVNLGDCLYGPLDPAGTAKILVPLDIPTVRGNEDRLITAPPAEGEISPTLRYVIESLSPAYLEWIETLEVTAVVDGNLFLCHGSPQRDDEYLLREVSENRVSLRGSKALLEKLSSLSSQEQRVILCGHDHVPCTVYLPDGRLIVNPGSVGLPAYDDDSPFPHAMETGSPHARYSIIYREKDGWWIENIALPYDWQTAADAAQKNRRPDWAHWLTTGRTL